MFREYHISTMYWTADGWMHVYIMSTWRWQANSYKDCIKCLVLCQMLMFIIASLVCTPNVGSMEGTQNVFNKIPIWSLELPWFWDMWNFRKGKRCCSCLDKCNRKGVEPDPVTFVAIHNGCASMKASMCINRSYQYGWLWVWHLWVTSLVDMYAKCQSM